MARESKVETDVEQIKQAKREDIKKEVEFISSGSTMINLAASGKVS